MLREITHFAGPLTLVAGALVIAVLTTALTGRLPLPAPVVFLAGAAAVSALLPSLRQQVSILAVERVASVALIVILFNGGRDIGARRLRRSLWEVASTGLLGTFITAAALSLAARVLLGLAWPVAGVIGAALAPTDPAVMFSVLGRREIAGRSGVVLEGEAGVNDPVGIALLLGMVQFATHPGATILVVVKDFALAMSIGVAVGLAGGLLLIRTLRGVRLGDSGLFPVLALTGAVLLYGAAALVGGSGFTSVFIAGLLLGDSDPPYGADITRFTASLASLAEVSVFLALGLTIDLGGIPASVWVQGLGLFLVMAVIVRPPVVALTLLGSALEGSERLFVAWSGLKGAVPILLAAFAVLAGVPHHREIYEVIFVVVLASVALQGSLVPAVAGALRIPTRVAPDLPWELAVSLAAPAQDHHELVVGAGSTADGARLDALPLPDPAWATLIVRDGHPVAARPDLRLQARDIVLVLGLRDAGPLAGTFQGR
jgi:cell volume regulation protein A